MPDQSPQIRTNFGRQRHFGQGEKPADDTVTKSVTIESGTTLTGLYIATVCTVLKTSV